jgi:hypothetical protein
MSTKEMLMPVAAADPIESYGLWNLDHVPLSPARQEEIELLRLFCGGPAGWQARKLAEVRQLFALEAVARRLRVVAVDVREAFRAQIYLEVPVACRVLPDGPLELHPAAMLGLTYPEEAVRRPMPGYSFVEILKPRNCWSANASYGAVQALCLGRSLPAGIRVKELILATYGALSMQTVQLDIMNPAGVMNPEAAVWWQANVDRVPLSREPFVS